jgi:hypothetical protein
VPFSCTFMEQMPPIVKGRRIIELYVFIFTGYPCWI